MSWDTYAAFYDWENARTLGRRDIPFWRRLARQARGRVLELGCGTGRVAIPLARAGIDLTGVDNAASMLARAREQSKRLSAKKRLRLVRADIRSLPFADASFRLVIGSYGMAQSLIADRDLSRALHQAARVLEPDGVLAIDLVPDLARWSEYTGRTVLSGKAPGGGTLRLIESVRLDRRKGLTTFDEEFVHVAGGRSRRHRFSLTFRNRPMKVMLTRIERAGFRVGMVIGDYAGGPWQADADTCIILAKRTKVLPKC